VKAEWCNVSAAEVLQFGELPSGPDIVASFDAERSEPDGLACIVWNVDGAALVAMDYPGRSHQAGYAIGWRRV
jgi:hypothetical protein